MEIYIRKVNKEVVVLKASPRVHTVDDWAIVSFLPFYLSTPTPDYLPAPGSPMMGADQQAVNTISALGRLLLWQANLINCLVLNSW